MTRAPQRSVRTQLRGWALWTAPPAVIGWVAAVVALAVWTAAAGAWTTPIRSADLLTWLALTGCAAVCVEAVRREGEPAGVSRDLLSVWTLPVALLLPPLYSLLVPIPLTVLQQLRVGRGPLYKRTFSVAAIGLANWVISVCFHHYLQRAGAGLAVGGTRLRWGVVLAVAVGCAVLGWAVNVFLVVGVIQLASPGATGWDLIADRGERLVDAGEICLGIVITSCWFLTPFLLSATLIPVVLVQRSLAHAQLRAAARLDAKTGVLNAKTWQEEAEREILRAHRQRQPVAVLIADIDHFKRVNDAHGHLAGDVALLATVHALLSELRGYDQLGRFGGEEFTIVLPGAAHDEACAVAERLRCAVAATPVPLRDTTVHLSVSVGVAVLGDHGHDLTDLLTAADHALYRAKQSGRNQIALAGAGRLRP